MSESKSPLIMGTKVRTFRNLKFWAERGQVRIIDQRKEDFLTVSVRSWLHRAQALSRQIDLMPYSDEREELVSALEMMAEVARDARKQGDPFDPAAMKHLVNTQHNNRAVMPRRACDVQVSPLILPSGVSFPAAPPSDPAA